MRRNTHKARRLAKLLAWSPRGVFVGELASGARRAKRAFLYVSAQVHGLVIGPPGTGKSAFLIAQLLDRVERKLPFIALDIKPELEAVLRPELEEAGYDVFVFNPTAPRDKYNPFDDIAADDTTAVTELAAALVPEAGEDTAAFVEGARDILDGVISYLRAEERSVSLPEIRDFLAAVDSERELIRVLGSSGDPDVREIAAALARSSANSRFMGSTFATLRSNLRFLRESSIRECVGESDFSLDKLRLSQKPTAIFLQFEERHAQATRRLLAVMVSHIMRWLITHTDRPPVLLTLDEIGNAPRIPDLVEKLNTMRSRNVSIWTYWQGVQQMQRYGLTAGEGPSSVFAACDLQMAFRLNDNDTARHFSERIGTVDRTAKSTTVSRLDRLANLFQTSRDTRSTTTTTVEEPVQKVADLQRLAPHETIVVYRGEAWRGRATPYFERWRHMRRRSHY